VRGTSEGRETRVERSRSDRCEQSDGTAPAGVGGREAMWLASRLASQRGPPPRAALGPPPRHRGHRLNNTTAERAIEHIRWLSTSGPSSKSVTARRRRLLCDRRAGNCNVIRKEHGPSSSRRCAGITLSIDLGASPPPGPITVP
jgi:hypothetical protein